MAVPLRNEGFGAGVAAWLVDQVVPLLPPRADGGLDARLGRGARRPDAAQRRRAVGGQ